MRSAVIVEGQKKWYFNVKKVGFHNSVRKKKKNAVIVDKWGATWQNQQNEYMPSEDSDQPGHPPSLIRDLAVRMKKPLVLCYPVGAQWRLRSAWASAQSDQRLRCPHEETFGPLLPSGRTVKTLIRMCGCPGWSESSLGAQSLCWFCHFAAQIQTRTHC